MIILFAVLGLIIIGIILDSNLRLRRLKREITAQWGKVKSGYTNIESVSRLNAYHHHPNAQRLSSQTLKDMDVDSLFGYVDRTNSGIGMQMLYSRICQPSMDITTLTKLTEAVELFQREKLLREKTQLLLRSMEKAGTSMIVDVFDPGVIPARSGYQSRMRLLTILALVVVPVFIFFTNLATLVLLIIILGINLNLHFFFRHRNRNTLQIIREVYRLKKHSARLNEIHGPADALQFKSAHTSLKRFRRLYLFLDLGMPMNDISAIAYYLLDLIRGIFLVEVHLLDHTYNEMLKQRPSIKHLFTYVGDVDCALSIASLKDTIGLVTCTPQFLISSNTLDLKNAIHPLIADCQGNSFCLDNSSALITGSNMSGKSTFLRTLIINVVMARSLHLCFASEARLSMTAVYSSISIADDLADNKSFYMQEVSVIHEMIRQSETSAQNIFVIDEIFKGTNTKERIALATAILHYLDNSNSLVIATSHDVQLTELTSETFRQFHFPETVEKGGIRFDFSIQHGPSGVGNAVKLVEAVGYPVEVVNAAKKHL